MAPRVSVIMGIKNGERFLRESVESIVAQTFNDFEFIIIDDGSTDRTAEILKEFSQKDSRVKIITNPQNLGLTKSLNIGIRAASGEYIARMDADDIAMPERFEKQVKFLDENSGHTLVGSWAQVIDEKGSDVRELKYPTADTELKKTLIKLNPFIHASIMMRRSALDQTGLYDEAWRYGQDYELYFRIAKNFKMANISELLLKHRINRDSVTRKNNREQARLALKARWRAIRSGQYSWFCLPYLFRPLASILVPYKLRKIIKS